MILLRASADKVGELLTSVEVGSTTTVEVADCNGTTFGVQAESNQKNKRTVVYFRFFTSCVFHSSFVDCYNRPTVCVTRWWVGRDNDIVSEPVSSHATCLKTRRLPPVGCTLCWH